MDFAIRRNMRAEGQKGVSAVEFAMLLPLLILLLLGSVEIGLLLYNQQVLTNASREGARAGITRKTVSEIGVIVDDYCDGRLMTWASGTWNKGDGNPPTIVVAGAGGAFQADLTVNVQYDHNFLVAGIVGLNQKTLAARTVMKMELDPSS